jgi:hypothetical protein
VDSGRPARRPGSTRPAVPPPDRAARRQRSLGRAASVTRTTPAAASLHTHPMSIAPTSARSGSHQSESSEPTSIDWTPTTMAGAASEATPSLDGTTGDSRRLVFAAGIAAAVTVPAAVRTSEASPVPASTLRTDPGGIRPIRTCSGLRAAWFHLHVLADRPSSPRLSDGSAGADLRSSRNASGLDCL